MTISVFLFHYCDNCRSSWRVYTSSWTAKKTAFSMGHYGFCFVIYCLYLGISFTAVKRPNKLVLGFIDNLDESEFLHYVRERKSHPVCDCFYVIRASLSVPNGMKNIEIYQGFLENSVFLEPSGFSYYNRASSFMLISVDYVVQFKFK